MIRALSCPILTIENHYLIFTTACRCCQGFVNPSFCVLDHDVTKLTEQLLRHPILNILRAPAS